MGAFSRIIEINQQGRGAKEATFTRSDLEGVALMAVVAADEIADESYETVAAEVVTRYLREK